MQNKIILFVCSILLFSLFGCSKDSVPDNEMPVLTIEQATEIGRKTATLYGTIYIPGGSVVKECGFIYSTVSSLPEAESKKVSIPLNGTSDMYSTTLTNLTPNTKYYYCLYANSGYTTTRSEVAEFVTAADGTPSLEATTSILATETSLTIASKISDDGGGTVQKFGFAYKISTSADAEKLLEATQKESDGRYTFTITGLTAETSYEVRAFATNGKGTGYGEKIILMTSAPEQPIVQLEAKAPSSTSLEVAAKLMNENNLSGSITEVGFCWSKEKQEPTTDDMKAISQLQGKDFTAIIRDLTPETTYYIRAYAINKKTKIGYSAAVTFTTSKSAAPKMDAITAVSVEETTAVLLSKIIDAGGHTITKFGFSYKIGTTGLETQTEVPTSELKPDGSYQFKISGLSPGVAYEVRSFAVNSAGTGYGATATITTTAQQAPRVSVELDTPTGNSVIAAGVVQSAGGSSSNVSEVGFCWSSTNPTPTIADGKMKATLDGTAFSATITNLKWKTKYYIRSYAVNEAKIGYSTVVEMTTPVSNVPEEGDIESPDKNN